jgi:hypothetical protein
MTKAKRVVLAVILAIYPLAVQAEYCYEDFGCYYETDGQFINGGTSWTESAGTAYTTPSRCGSSSKLAELQGTEYVQQSFYVNNSHPSFTVVFHAYLQNDTNNWYDDLEVRVTNNDTNQYETLTLHGDSFSSTCSPLSFNLSNDYSNANVTLRFKGGTVATGTYEVDGVAFVGNYY